MADRKSTHHRWLYIPWGIAAAVFVAYLMLWRYGADEMKNAVNLWVEDQRAAGFDVSHGALKADGFPFFLRLHVEEPRIAAPGVWAWRTKRLTMDALPYDLNRLIFSTRSEQTLSVDGYGDWRITAEDFRVSIANDKKRDWMFAATIGGATAKREEDGAEAALGNLVIDLAPDEADMTVLTLNLMATQAHLDAEDAEIDLDKIQAALSASEIYALSDAESWRRAGGALQINGFFAQLEEGRFAAAGTLKLDENGSPEGTLKTEIIAPAPFIQLLARTGALSPDEAESAAATLTLATIAAGGKLTAPIELKEGAAHLAGAKIADLPSAN
ncbi:DUF2125 domain-containing protein [Hyphococcus sp.]|uniref:DUF2125 domain-containing protein n=1 Tax=Hyphococcus sp. TaxID=2038636 RepID=UPI0035C684C2